MTDMTRIRLDVADGDLGELLDALFQLRYLGVDLAWDVLDADGEVVFEEDSQ